MLPRGRGLVGVFFYFWFGELKTKGVEVGRKRDGSGRNDGRYEGVEGAFKGRKK